MFKTKRLARHKKYIKKIRGTEERPRVSVFRSSQHIYAQIINDEKGLTLVSSSDLDLSGTKTEKATQVGQRLAKAALDKKISKVVFDKGAFKYHGRVAALAEGLREGGLQF
jgi:large subunit ribosomal protein L18